MQRHGLIVADNGSDMYVTGTFDTRWNNDILNPAFALLSASDFEVVQLGWKPASGGAALASVAASPNPVVGSNASTATVTLTAAAPVNGAPVSLSSASGIVQVPATATVPAGATSATFAIATSAVTTQTLVTVSASYGGVTRTTTVTVNPAAPFATLAALAVNPASVKGGGSAIGTVTLTAPAPSSGVSVALASPNASIASVPKSAVVAAGTIGASFTIATTRPRKSLTVTISASYAGVTKSAALTVTRR